MWKLKPSPRTIKATEKYIFSLGRKREELTEEQWNLIVNYIQNRRIAIPILLIFCLVCAVMTSVYWHLGHKYSVKAVPSCAVKVSFNGKQEPITLSPENIRQYLNYVTECYLLAGTQIMLALELLVFAVLSATLTGTMNRKMHRILLSRPAAKDLTV